MYISLRVKYSLSLSEYAEIWIFLYIFSKNTHISNFMKICPVGAEQVTKGERADREDEANSRFSRFCEKRLKIT